MGKITVKVGTEVSIPTYPGMTVTSSDPTVIGVQQGPNSVKARALKPGVAWLEVLFVSDLGGKIQVTVVA
jgi:hypothetical protein